MADSEFSEDRVTFSPEALLAWRALGIACESGMPRQLLVERCRRWVEQAPPEKVYSFYQLVCHMEPGNAAALADGWRVAEDEHHPDCFCVINPAGEVVERAIAREADAWRQAGVLRDELAAAQDEAETGA